MMENNAPLQKPLSRNVNSSPNIARDNEAEFIDEDNPSEIDPQFVDFEKSERNNSADEFVNRYNEMAKYFEFIKSVIEAQAELRQKFLEFREILALHKVQIIKDCELAEQKKRELDLQSRKLQEALNHVKADDIDEPSEWNRFRLEELAYKIKCKESELLAYEKQSNLLRLELEVSAKFADLVEQFLQNRNIKNHNLAVAKKVLLAFAKMAKFLVL